MAPNGGLFVRHVIDFQDITLPEWHDLYRTMEDMLLRPEDYRTALSGRVMASLFFEPSTRTNFSFQAAMQRLGGGVFGFNDPASTSASKGETMKDTMIMVSGYADVIVQRHPREGAALAASLYASCPIINAGDGGHWHPTQTLTDLATITHLRGKVDGICVGLCGDLKNGRTVHSLIRALSRFEGVQLMLISPRELAVPSYIHRFMRERGMKYVEATNLEASLGQLDVLYMTRIQRERFLDPLEYERLKGVYVLTAQKMRLAKPDMLVLHPLPRVDEIHPGVDDDSRAAYFRQAEIGMVIRQALLLHLALLPKITPPRNYPPGPRVCRYAGCITAYEGYLPPLTDNSACGFCEHELEEKSL